MTDQANKVQTAPELISPAAQGQINSAISGAIKETLAAIAPILASVAMTPEKMQEMERLRRAPSADELRAKQREAREKRLMKEDLDEAQRNKQATQKSCSHKDANARWSVSLIHNYPDRQARGICCHCHLLIEPLHWEIFAPTEKHPRGEPKLVPAHPLYHIVAEVQQISGQM